MRRLFSALILTGLVAAAGVWLYRSPVVPSREVVLDLAERLPFAARSAQRQVIMFGWPDAEPHLVSGFGGDPESRGRERFLWVRQGATLKLATPDAHDRALIFDIEAYPGLPDQRLRLAANGRDLGSVEVPETRSRVRFDWPAGAQGPVNELTLRFSGSVVPANQPDGSGDTRDLAAALFSLTVGDQADDAFDLLQERETPRAYEVAEKEGVPSLTLPGQSQTSFAFRLPQDAVLELEGGLHPWSVSAGGKGSLQIAFDASDGRTRESIKVPLTSPDPQAVRVALEGEPGTPFLVRLDLVSDNPGVTFARIRAPRILGRAPANALPPSQETAALKTDFDLKKPNVLLLVLDAARAQSFGAYGYPRDTTPNLDRLAKDGFVFDNAYTTAAYTLAAMASVWTSQQPDRHHGDVAFSAKVPADRLMLAEVLTAQGVQTAGFVANGVAGAFNGFDRGFKEFVEPWKEYGSQASGFRNVLPPFLDRMKADGHRFFAYVHYREPHHPYDPPPPFDTRFGPDAPIPKSRREAGEASEKWTRDINQGVIQPTPEEIDHLRRLYDGNLAFADQEVGYLREQLESRGLLANTIVIVAGDHGEALFEHGFIGHNTQVFEETARIPLLVWLPPSIRGSRPPARVSALVDLTDIAPTILDIFGLSGAGGSGRAFQGQSLLPRLTRRGPAGRDSREVLTRTVWDRPVYAVRNVSHTFIYNTSTSEFSLFDRSSPRPHLEDPEHDYAPRAPIALREMYRQNLLAYVASLKRRAVAGDKLEGMSRVQCEELKSLGYLSATTACPQE